MYIRSSDVVKMVSEDREDTIDSLLLQITYISGFVVASQQMDF